MLLGVPDSGDSPTNSSCARKHHTFNVMYFAVIPIGVVALTVVIIGLIIQRYEKSNEKRVGKVEFILCNILCNIILYYILI